MLLAPNGNAILDIGWKRQCTVRNVVVALCAATVLDVDCFEVRPRPVSGLNPGERDRGLNSNRVSHAGRII
jgi:hypothetical protein